MGETGPAYLPGCLSGAQGQPCGRMQEMALTMCTHHVPGFGPRASCTASRALRDLHLTAQETPCGPWLHSLEGPGLEFR